MFHIDPPNGWNTRRWYRQFVNTGCVCEGKCPGRIKNAFQHVGRLVVKPYKLQLLQALCPDEKRKRVAFLTRFMVLLTNTMFKFGSYRTYMQILNMYEIRPKSMRFVRYPDHPFAAHFSLKEKRLTVNNISVCYKIVCFRGCTKITSFFNKTGHPLA
ncbi:hypothetical protein J6590_036291 [Homalodisca vitripennis]|nr:hypothetical protein J6590_036291 [Homalodisca vitripennis]